MANTRGKTTGWRQKNGKLKISISMDDDSFNYINALANTHRVSFNVAIGHLIKAAVDVDKDMQWEEPEYRLSGGLEKHSRGIKSPTRSLPE